jgi:hypothetical protein
MQRINWADPSLSGGLFEKIVGCLLGIEYRESIRVRPSQGDGGVDIFIPVGDGTIDVHQVKHYPSRIHWAKVQKSLDRLVDGQWLGRTVRTWYLTVPKQPTPNNLTKFDEITADASFDTQWFGEDHLAALAARHPEVADYYLGDGRTQLERQIEDWDVCLTRLRDGESPRIEDAQQRLTEIAGALGRRDPHLEYGVDVHPASRSTAPPSRPGAIAMSSSTVGNHLVTCYAYPRYRGAAEDAADRLKLYLRLAPEAKSRVAEAIAVGGDPVELTPTDIIDYELPVVGHQPPAQTELFARLTPLVDSTPAGVRLVFTTAAGDVTLVPFTRRSLTRGIEGATTIWASPAKCVELTIVVNARRERLQFRLQRGVALDGSITCAADDINLLRALQPGTTIAVALDRGPVQAATPMVTLTEGLFDSPVISMLVALRAIQDHTITTVTIPDEITEKDLQDLIETAALLEGLPSTGDMRSVKVSVTLPESAVGSDGAQDVFGDHFTLAMAGSAGNQIALPHQTIELPDELLVVRVFRTARVAAIEDTDDDMVQVTLEPGLLPLWVDQRIDRAEDFTDELHHRLCQTNEPIAVGDLIAQLAAKHDAGSR